MTSIEAHGITKSYGRVRAVDGIDLTVGAGITGVLGPNGAGKTTFLRMLATALAPDAGTLRLLGRDPADAAQRVEIRRRLGYVPQEPGLHPNFTVFEFVDYVAILKEMVDRRTRHDEVRRVIALVGLTDMSRRRIRTLSGGMKRRVGLAQALLGDPELLVLDEPTAGLDPEQRLRFRDLVSSASTAHAVVLSTHQTEDVAALCNRVVIIDHGRVQFDGTTQDLAQLANGAVWVADTRSPAARASWRTADGRHRNIGTAPPGSDLVAPTIEDAYLLLVGAPTEEVAA